LIPLICFSEYPEIGIFNLEKKTNMDEQNGLSREMKNDCFKNKQKKKDLNCSNKLLKKVGFQ